MATKSNNPPIKTLEITNFGGQLTRTLNGDLNSGLARFDTSFGYDFYSKPGNLTWLEVPTEITGPIGNVVLAGKIRSVSENNLSAYMIDHAGSVYQMWVNNFLSGGSTVSLNSVVGIASVKAGSPTFDTGASVEIFSASVVGSVQSKLYISSQTQINSMDFNTGSTWATSNADKVVTNNLNYNGFHPIKAFVGKLLIGDGSTVDAVDNTNTFISSIFGKLDADMRVKDIDVSIDGNYSLSSAATTDFEEIGAAVQNNIGAQPADGKIYYWNGADLNSTALLNVPGSQLTALQTYLQNSIFFITDSMGMAVSNGTQKLFTLPNNKSPSPNATGTNDNFLFWTSIESVPTASSSTLVASMYYYGSVDGVSAPGLYRMCRIFSTSASGNIIQTPFNVLASNAYSDINPSLSSVISVGYGQHYLSVLDSIPSNPQKGRLYSFYYPSSGTRAPQFGVYQTQAQIFSKKITIKQIRVYTEPTVSGNRFQVNVFGSTQFTLTQVLQYAYAAGTDTTQLQGSLDRIDFNPTMEGTYSFSIGIQNLGTTNMTIKKIEVDYVETGK